MKIVKLTIILIVIISSTAFSQSITLFNVDASEFPLMRAKFYAFDESGNQYRPSISELRLTENGIERTIINVSCPPAEPPIALSTVLTIDVSGSMNRGRLTIAQEAARAWVHGLPLGKSECAITSFSDYNFLNQDFTTDRESLLYAINTLMIQGGTDYDAALLKPVAGSLQISRRGQFQKVIVMLTDGRPNQPPDVYRIVAEANKQNCIIYAVSVDILCPPSLKEISTQTGGKWYEDITTVEQVKAIYMEILQSAQGGEPCTIEWESEAICKAELINVDLQWNSAIGKTSYTPPVSLVMRLDYEPPILRFEELELGVWQSEIVRVTARNGHFVVTDIEISNSSYDITPKSFVLNSGDSIDLTVSYFPDNLGYQFSRFALINETCPSFYTASSGVRGLRPTERTIKLIHPNGGEIFIAGSDTVITWEGVPEDEPVKLEYRTSDLSEWITIADSATGLIYPFRVPNMASDEYLARVTSAIKYEKDYCPVEIGNQIWMCENLDVTHYRNGEPIPEVTDQDEWANLTTGAWCYYENDPANGEVYGKLYNWYAVNDPRGLAPEGWRVPSDADWQELEMHLGMTQEQSESWELDGRGSPVGAKLAGEYDLWRDGDLRNNVYFNSSGFSGLPGGYGHGYDGFGNIRTIAYWWSSVEHSSTQAIYRSLRYNSTNVFRSSNFKRHAFSVRCIKE